MIFSMKTPLKQFDNKFFLGSDSTTEQNLQLKGAGAVEIGARMKLLVADLGRNSTPQLERI
jgi:hypothetical protein